MTGSDPTAFDALASDYDNSFTCSALGRMLRARVWEKLDAYYSAGQHVLELACGTGEDAVWLAKRGVYVTATDGSAAMIHLARSKADRAGVSDRVEALQVSCQDIIERQTDPDVTYDGAYSNFGGLNTIRDWHALARALSELVKPRGTVILVPMGPICPWEIVWYAGHGRLGTAFRRFRHSTSAQIGGVRIPIWYPSAKKLKADFSPWFQYIQAESLGLGLPPSYLDHFVNKWPNLFAKINRVERRMAPLTKAWGDHFMIVFQRRG